MKRGDEPLRIMHRAGHKDLTTTMGYVREAENLRAGCGTVFPPSLFGTGGMSQLTSRDLHQAQQRPQNKFDLLFGVRDSNPRSGYQKPASCH